MSVFQVPHGSPNGPRRDRGDVKGQEAIFGVLDENRSIRSRRTETEMKRDEGPP